MMPIIIPTGLKTRGYLTSRLPDAIYMDIIKRGCAYFDTPSIDIPVF